MRTVVLLSLLSNPFALAAEIPGPLGLGPLNLGMTIEEIRMAAPSASWRNVLVSPFTSKVFAVRTTSPFDIAGLPFHAYAEVGYYERIIQLDAALEAADAAQCELTALEWLTRFEGTSGPFAGASPRLIPGRPGGLQWHVQTSRSGSVSVTPSPGIGTPDRTEGERISFGQSSTALVDAFDVQFRPRARRSLLGGQPARFTLTTARHLPDQTLSATVNFGMTDEFARIPGRDQERPQGTGTNCTISVTLQRSSVPPPPQPFDVSRHPQLAQLSMAERHLAYPRDAEDLPEPIDVEQQCDVSRQTGLVLACQPTSPAWLPGPLSEAAHRMVRSLQFDVREVDRDDPQALRGPVRVRLEPGDRQSLDFVAVERTPLDRVVWSDAPQAGEIIETGATFFGASAGGANPVSIELACRILGDGSLLCVATGSDPTYLRNTAVRLAAAHYRAAPALRDGSPSAGRVVDLTVLFRPSL